VAIGSIQRFNDAIDRFYVVIFQAPAQGISQQFFGKATIEVEPMALNQGFFNVTNVVEFFTGNQFASRVDGYATLIFTPHAQRIEIFQSQA
jgi:hypothetical protein